LTSSYAVAYKTYGTLECEVVVESNMHLPIVIEGNISAGFGIKKAYTELGRRLRICVHEVGGRKS
jgi:hypothetical protein